MLFRSLKLVPLNSMSETRTTLTLTRLPSAVHGSDLVNLLNHCGYEGRYNFVKVPINDVTQKNLSLGVINFIHAEDAASFKDAFHGMLHQEGRTKAMAVNWSKIQGVAPNLTELPVTVLTAPRNNQPHMIGKNGENLSVSFIFRARTQMSVFEVAALFKTQ